MKKIGQFLTCVLPLICAIGIQIIVASISIIIFGIFQGIRLAATSGETDINVIANSLDGLMNSSAYLFITAISAIVCGVVFGLWYRKILVGIEKLKIKEVLTGKKVLFIILLGIALNSGISVVLNIVGSIKPGWFENYNEIMKQLGYGDSIISMLLIVVIAPISEELICRGVILEKCRKVMPLFAANIIQAILFGVYHMNVIQGIYAFVLGLFLGMVCIKTGSIYGAILLHIIFNLSGVFLENILTENILPMKILMIGMGMVSLIIIVISTIMLLNEKDREVDLGSVLEDKLL